MADENPEITQIRVVSSGKVCIVCVYLPENYKISRCPECDRRSCRHRDLEGFETDDGLDASGKGSVRYFTTNATNDVLQALSLAQKPVQWVKTHMVKDPDAY